MAQLPEGVAWQPGIVKDQRRYGKLKGLLKKSLPIGIRTTTMNLLKSHHKTIRINMLPSNTKFINPYTFLGLMVTLHQVDALATYDRDEDILFTTSGVTQNSLHCNFAVRCTFNERNPEFHMAKV